MQSAEKEKRFVKSQAEQSPKRKSHQQFEGKNERIKILQRHQKSTTPQLNPQNTNPPKHITAQPPEGTKG
jgi:hypothetical protein